MADWTWMSMEECAEKVRYGKDDEPDKYGYTKKMLAILDLIEHDKTLDDADFEPTKDDINYYELEKAFDEMGKEMNGGKRKHKVRFIND